MPVLSTNIIKVFLAIILALGSACKCCHETTTTGTANSNPQTVNSASASESDQSNIEKNISEGIVHKTDLGDCQYIITVMDGDKQIKFYPLNLPDDLKVDMIKIKFAYQLSRKKPQPGCLDARPIMVESASKM